ncbi:MAG: GerMN domain-containing protein [Acidimicrobiia bacterium]|nr:GerMN domain-containing protein [Acidimicrobiia bacterium]
MSERVVERANHGHGLGARWCHVGAFAVAVVLAAGGCSISSENAPRDIPVDQRGQLDLADPSAGEATGASRIFLVTATGPDDGQRLQSVLRDVPADPEAVLQALLAGPNEGEFEAELRTAVPGEEELLAARLIAGTLNVDLTGAIQTLPPATLVLAVAQIVFTASEIDGVRSVRLRIEGEAGSWPDGFGELQSRPLTVYDFPGVALSAQPGYPPIPSEL